MFRNTFTRVRALVAIAAVIAGLAATAAVPEAARASGNCAWGNSGQTWYYCTRPSGYLGGLYLNGWDYYRADGTYINSWVCTSAPDWYSCDWIYSP